MLSKSVRQVITVLSSKEEGADQVENKLEDNSATENYFPDEPSSPTMQKDESEVASRATQIVQVISEENMCLRKQLDKCCQEIRRLQNMDKELRNTQIMYKDLKSAFINREHKEKAMRLRLEAEITQLQKTNAEITEKAKEPLNLKKSQEDIEALKETINKRDEEIKKLQKERAAAKRSLQNLERVLKRKSSEIINLQQQLASGDKMDLKQQKEEKIKVDDTTKLATFHGLGEIWQQNFTRGEKLRDKNNKKCRSHSSEYNVSTCVPVLVDLLKEKDGEITNLRNEINKITLTSTEGTKENNWSLDRSDKMLPQNEHHGNNETYTKYSKDEQRRYSDLETAIKSLHVQLAEKDAMIKIFQCKYGIHDVNCQHSALSTVSSPIRTPSFTSQVSSISSHEDSGIMTPPDCVNREILHQDKEAEKYQSEHEYQSENNMQPSVTQQEDDQLNDHCWFV